ncbi:MAG TPA: Asp-tRNA(Asn)/Glu-tRNA(Gln) amidotransferase subunit GatC, partial [Acidobacteriaceae bacterium]
MSTAGEVTLDQVRHVADLANLELTAEELPRLARDLNAILGHIAQLNELDT